MILECFSPSCISKYLNIFIPQLDFEIDCGHDDICVDDLRMDFNFSG